MYKAIFNNKALPILITFCFLSLFFRNNMNSICLGFLFFYSVFYSLTSKNYSLPFKNEFIYLYIYYGVLLVSVIYSENSDVALKLTLRSIAFIVVPLSFNYLPNLPEKKKYAVRKYYIGFVILLLLFLFANALYRNYILGNSILDYLYQKILVYLNFSEVKSDIRIEYWLFSYEGLTNVINMQPIYVSLFVNLAYAFTISLKEKKVIPELLFWLISVYFLFFILLLSSRTEMLIFVALMFYYLLFIKSRTKKELILNSFKSFMLVFCLMFVVLNNPILKYRVISVIKPDYKREYVNFANQNIRFQKWNSAKELITESPILGYGIGDFQAELISQYKRNNFEVGVMHKYNSHNQYLDTMLQIGLFGFLILILFFIRSFFWYSRDNFEKKIILIIFLFSFITESMFNRHWGIVSFVLFISFTSKYKLNNIISENSNIRN